MNKLNTYYCPYRYSRSTAKGMWVPRLERLPQWRAVVLPGALRVVVTELECVAVREHGGDPSRSPARSWDAPTEEASQDENEPSSPPRLTSRHGPTSTVPLPEPSVLRSGARQIQGDRGMDSLSFSFLDHGSATEAGRWGAQRNDSTLDRSAIVLQPCMYVSVCHDMT
ncbi:hypothetical protein GW17_00032927 [Ensete ventricosum]|nr:hypothetical protein GW17_00032927 [Ensete ventricosum]RZR94500.1 hypothetical protein BHM03_00023202 [Ensete ventricosum]